MKHHPIAGNVEVRDLAPSEMSIAFAAFERHRLVGEQQAASCNGGHCFFRADDARANAVADAPA